MKLKKAYALYAFFICFFTLPKQNFFQKPFSPCATDIPKRIFFLNDFKEAFFVYSPQPKTISSCEEIPLEEAISQVTVQVNKKILEEGKKLEIIPTKPLKISVKAPINSLIDYLMKTDLLNDVDHTMVKKVSTALFRYTACIFTNKNPEQLYNENRTSIMCGLLRAYRNTIGIFGATCEVQITLTPEKIMELIDDPTNPVIDFHGIFGEIAHSIGEPTRWRNTGTYYSPVINIA